MKIKPFSKWTISEVEDAFQVVLRDQNELLRKWLTIRSEPSPEEERQLGRLSKKLWEHVFDWNETELKVHFVGLLLNMVDFDQETYQPFMERELSFSHEDEIISGVVDLVVAQGRRIPKRHFFFINEYKKEKDSSDDPLGQLMIAMVAAQKLNDDSHPVYGAYVVGRYWNFVVLSQLEYSVSLSYDATKDEIKHIFCILKNVKAIIDDLMRGDRNQFDLESNPEGESRLKPAGTSKPNFR